jgi:saccharopine dehydrogenase-like NADP-dependent oxidoreductase
MKKVCVLGAGMVSMPIIRFLLQKNYEVCVASNDLSKVEKEVDTYPNGRLFIFDIQNQTQLSALVQENDIIVSLLPYVFHPVVAKECVRYAKHLVTASYIKPEMQALDAEAKKCGIAILNELGLIPALTICRQCVSSTIFMLKEGKWKNFIPCAALCPLPKAHTTIPFAINFLGVLKVLS